VYDAPSDPPLPGFPLYSDIDCDFRYWTELMARDDVLNLAIHEVLYGIAGDGDGRFENDLTNFLFFMDGNTRAKERFEQSHPNEAFPIVQQTFVVHADHAVAFAENCVAKMRSLKYNIVPAECDMLFALRDECFLSGNYQMDGFAISLGFEPIEPLGCPKPRVPALLEELSRDCADIGGRLHIVKNVYVERDVFRRMYDPQIRRFEELKKQYDPDLILQNTFSDRFFDFR